MKELGKNKKNPFTTEQLLDATLKNKNGESRAEVTKRMEESFEKVKTENEGKTIAIVSHGASIKFLLLKWCKLDKENNLVYDNKKIELASPGVVKLVFDGLKLVEMKQVL